MDELDMVAIEITRTIRRVILTLIGCVTLYNIITSDRIISFSIRPAVTQSVLDMPPLRK